MTTEHMVMAFGLGGLGMGELGIIAAVALLIFGPRQIPKLARSLGETIKEMKRAGRAVTESIEEGTEHVAGDLLGCDFQAVAPGEWRCQEHHATVIQDTRPSICSVARRQVQSVRR